MSTEMNETKIFATNANDNYKYIMLHLIVFRVLFKFVAESLVGKQNQCDLII